MQTNFWNDFYTPPDPNLWQGRPDALQDEQMYQQITCINLAEFPLATNTHGFAFVGFCCDEGIKRNNGRMGAAEGPYAIRKTLGKFATHFSSPIQVFDVGNIVCKDQRLEEAQTALGQIIQLLLDHHLHPIVLGGGHETAWGHYQGIYAHHASSLGVINFDAHFDLRPLTSNTQGHSGTPFLQIAKHRQSLGLSFDYFCIGIQPNANTHSLFATARQLNTQYIEAETLYLKANEHMLALEKFIASQAKIYLSICLDVFGIAFAPGVSAPQALGLTPWQVVPLLKKIIQSGKVISIDFVELSPPLDQNNKTALLAAALIMTYLQASV